MNSYFSLIPISAKVHRRQNRMTHLCIIFAVFLVTAVFGMAEAGIRLEMDRLFAKHGSQALSSLVRNESVLLLFAASLVLSGLILLAGVLMISSSLNSNVAQRTKFFGMMRCIGMSRQQIIRFVRLEALYWCKTAIPAGVLSGIAATWALCALLRFFVGGEFSDIAVFRISPISIAAGAVQGIVTVLIAAGAPAKQAAKVSPITAVSGAQETDTASDRFVNPRFFKIETALGIRHAVSAKKNLLLMTGSFALSIILFLSFSVLTEFLNHVMPQFSNAADFTLSSADASNSADVSLPGQIRQIGGVKQVFGRRSCFDVSAKIEGDEGRISTVDLISYDDFDLECLKKDGLLKKGSDLAKVYGNSSYVLAICGPDSLLKTGSVLRINGEPLTVAGILKYNPFSDDGSTDGKVTLITSGQTFVRLTQETGYSLILIQTAPNLTKEQAAAIHCLSDESLILTDRRQQRTTGLYLAFQLFIYGFLAIIALVCVLNIMNSISMSVSARMKQYGAMRAIGMDARQVTRMIFAEAFTYGLLGSITGTTSGLFLSKLLYDSLIASHYSYASWSISWHLLAIILTLVTAATFAAVYGPARRIRNMAVTENIKAL